MWSGLMRWRMSLAVSATLVRSCSTVSVRPARVCSVSRFICCSERVSVMASILLGIIRNMNSPMMALVPDALGAAFRIGKSGDDGAQRAWRRLLLR